MGRPFEQLDRQRRAMLWLVGLLLAALCAALMLTTWTAGEAMPTIELNDRWPSMAGLCGLVVLFVLYVQHKSRQLSVLESRLRDHAVREAALQARFSELSFLFDTSTQIQLRLDLNSMLDLAAQRLVPCLDAHQSSIMLFNESTGELEVKAAAGIDSERVLGATTRPGEGVSGHVFSTGETLNLTPEMVKQRFPEAIEYGRQIVAGLCVPMRFRGNPIGVVNVTRTSGEPFSDLHANILASFAEHCAATVVKTHHHHELLQTVRQAA